MMIDRRCLFGLAVVAPAIALDVLPSARQLRQSFKWQHFSFTYSWGNKCRSHICVRAETRLVAIDRLLKDDPVWKDGVRTRYHGEHIERVGRMPLPDRFVGWLGEIDDPDDVIATQRIARFAAVQSDMA